MVGNIIKFGPRNTGPHGFITPRMVTGSHRVGVGGRVSGGYSVGETPGPIPNPEAKTRSADGTAPGRVWESRTPPEIGRASCRERV